MFDSVAVVGATGAVGTIIRELLEARKFPFKQIKFLASRRSAGQAAGVRRPGSTWSRSCGRRPSTACNWPSAARPDEVARDFIPEAVRRGCVVIDESGYWRMDPKVPLVIPEVNPEAIRKHQGIIASPNCSTTQMVAGAEAAARRRPRPPRGREHLSGHQRGRAGRQPRSGERHPGHAGRRGLPLRDASPTPSPSTAFRRSARRSTRATPRKR